MFTQSFTNAIFDWLIDWLIMCCFCMYYHTLCVSNRCWSYTYDGDIDVVCATVKRVVNQSGPQTADGHRDAVCQRMPHTVTAGSVSTECALPAAINERLSSMEVHVKLCTGKCNHVVLSFSKEKWFQCQHVLPDVIINTDFFAKCFSNCTLKNC